MSYKPKSEAERAAIPEPYKRLEEATRLSLGASNYSSKTISTYAEAIRGLGAYISATQGPTDPSKLRVQHIEGYIVNLKSVVSPKTKRPYSEATINNRWRGLQSVFQRASAAGLMRRSPIAGRKPPRVTQVPIPIIREDKFAAMLRTCKGKGFLAVRDTALLLFFYDTGVRLSEACGVKLSDIDWAERTVLIHGKGAKDRYVPLGKRTLAALRNYIDTVRAKHRISYREELWLGREKVFTENGIYQMVRERGLAVELDKMHPHVLRHTFIHNCLAAGMSEGHVMELTGITSREMMDRYAKSTRAERAIADHRRLSPADRLAA